MTWSDPTSLWALLIVALAGVLVAWSVWRYRKAVDRFGDRSLLERLGSDATLRQRWVQSGLVVGALMLFVLALAGPRWGTTTTDVRHESLDLLVALDVSHSMLAEDVAPSRLERSRYEVMRLVEALPGDRFGLVLFAGDAFLQCPLTNDRNAIRLFLETADPSVIPTPGTDVSRLGPVVHDAFERVGSAPDRARVLLIVSDGEFHAGDVRRLRADFREAGITTLAIGVGEADGARIPERDADGEEAYRRDRDGGIVVTRLEETTLRTLAGDAGYVHVGRTGDTAEQLVPILQRLERAEIDLTSRSVPVERFQWPLVLALLLLFAERLMPATRRKSATQVAS